MTWLQEALLRKQLEISDVFYRVVHSVEHEIHVIADIPITTENLTDRMCPVCGSWVHASLLKYTVIETRPGHVGTPAKYAFYKDYEPTTARPNVEEIWSLLGTCEAGSLHVLGQGRHPIPVFVFDHNERWSCYQEDSTGPVFEYFSQACKGIDIDPKELYLSIYDDCDVPELGEYAWVCGGDLHMGLLVKDLAAHGMTMLAAKLKEELCQKLSASWVFSG